MDHDDDDSSDGRCSATAKLAEAPHPKRARLHNDDGNGNENDDDYENNKEADVASSSGVSEMKSSETDEKENSGPEYDEDVSGGEKSEAGERANSDGNEEGAGNKRSDDDEEADADENADGDDDDEDNNAVDDDDDDDNDEPDEDLLRRILAAAQSQGIPLEYLATQLGFAIDDGDDEEVEYPFDQPPTCLADVAAFIKSDKCRRILVLAGAGMSVASGIPDFRSSNGLYATLDANVLTATPAQKERIADDPSYSLDNELFMENPLPCLEVNREFVLGVQERRWKATLAHRFVEMLHSRTMMNVTEKNDQDKKESSSGSTSHDSQHSQQQKQSKLVRLYTQNIDGLEDQCTQMDPHRLRIAVHGSMDEAECASCYHKMDFDDFCYQVKTQIKDITGRDDSSSLPLPPTVSTPIVCPTCGGSTMKPSIVLFHSRLPEVFFNSVPNDIEDVDLFIVIGTSLAVAPANSLVWRVPKSAMRVLINRDPVGWSLGMDYESHDRDFFAQGDCENVVLELMDELGWLEELRSLLDTNGLPEASAKLLRDRLEDKEKNKADGTTDMTDQKAPSEQAMDVGDKSDVGDGDDDRKRAAI